MVVDSGARGHALARSYLDSGVDGVLVTPGNDGLRGDFINQNLTGPQFILTTPHDITSLKDPESILKTAKMYQPNLIDVAQDDALANGTVDLLQHYGFSVFGPTQDAAQIEWDKAWSRKFMKRHNIPHPEYRIFHRDTNPSLIVNYAKDLLKKHEKIFFKASGLYAGKGVIGVESKKDITLALEKLADMGEASQTFLVEQGLQGQEFSYYVMSDGEHILDFNRAAQDNKRVFNQDKGENTGGMGAHSPVQILNGLEWKVMKDIIKPTIQGLKKEDRLYTGILYLGGMLCDDGSIKVVEFNSRWGDPECHVILPSITKSNGASYLDLVNSALEQKLDKKHLHKDHTPRVSIVGASTGYPGDYEKVKGKRLFIDYKGVPEGVNFLSAGIKVQDNKMYIAGGRIFSTVASGNTLMNAREKALAAMACCHVEGNGLHYRTDIAWREIEWLWR